MECAVGKNIFILFHFTLLEPLAAVGIIDTYLETFVPFKAPGYKASISCCECAIRDDSQSANILFTIDWWYLTSLLLLKLFFLHLSELTIIYVVAVEPYGKKEDEEEEEERRILLQQEKERLVRCVSIFF